MNPLLKTLAAIAAFTLLPHTSARAEEATAQGADTFIVEDTMREILTTLHNRLGALRKGELPVANCGYDTRIWGGGIGMWQNTGMRDGMAGYKYNGAGAILGMDRTNGATTFGAAISSNKGDIKVKNPFLTHQDMELAQYSVNAYATCNLSRNFFLTLTGGYTYSTLETHIVDIDDYSGNEDYAADTFNAGARLGFDFERGQGFVITPSIGMDFFHSNQRVFTSKFIDDVGDLYLRSRTDGMKHNAVEIPLDIRISREISFGGDKTLQLSVNGGYAYNLNDKPAYGNSEDEWIGFPPAESVYNISQRQGHYTWKAGAGARFKSNQWDVAVKYDYLRRTAYNAHKLMTTVGYSF